MEHSKEAAWGEMQKAGYIAEDAIPRNGGQWPEYAHTLKICVDSFDAQLAEERFLPIILKTHGLFTAWINCFLPWTL